MRLVVNIRDVDDVGEDVGRFCMSCEWSINVFDKVVHHVGQHVGNRVCVNCVTAIIARIVVTAMANTKTVISANI